MEDEIKPVHIEAENEDAAEEYEVDLAKSQSTAVKGKTEDFFEEGEGQLAIDVYQTSDEIIIEAPIAGVNPDELDVDITNDSVTVRGRRDKTLRVKEEDYFYQECYWGKFSRSIILPQEVDSEKAEASLKNGVLTVTLPKLTRQKAKKVKVKFE